MFKETPFEAAPPIKNSSGELDAFKQSVVEDKNSIATAIKNEHPEGADFGQTAKTVYDHVRHATNVAVDAGSFATGSLLDLAMDKVNNWKTEDTPDLTFQESLKNDPTFKKNLGIDDIPFDAWRDEISTSPNANILAQRLQNYRLRESAKREMATSTAAQVAGMAGAISEMGLAFTAGPIAGGLVKGAGLGVRMAVGAGADVVSGATVDIAQAKARHDQLDATDFITNVVLNGTLGAVFNGTVKADIARAADFAKKTQARIRGEIPLTEVTDVGDLVHGNRLEPLPSANTLDINPQVNPTGTPVALPDAPNYSPKDAPGEFPTQPVTPIKINPYRAIEDARVADPESVHFDLPIAPPHPQVVADAMQNALKVSDLKATVRSAQDYLRTMPHDFEGIQKALQNEAAWEARLGVKNMPEGWLTNGSPEKATALLMREKMAQTLAELKAAPGADSRKSAKLIKDLETNLAHQETILQSLEKPRLIDSTGEARLDGIVDTHVANAPAELLTAKPTYHVDGSRYTPQFDSLVDKALFMVGQAKQSFHDSKYMDYLKGIFPEHTADDIRGLGAQVNSHGVRPLAENVPLGERPRWKESADLRVSNFWKDNIPTTKAEIKATEEGTHAPLNASSLEPEVKTATEGYTTNVINAKGEIESVAAREPYTAAEGATLKTLQEAKVVGKLTEAHGAAWNTVAAERSAFAVDNMVKNAAAGRGLGFSLNAVDGKIPTDGFMLSVFPNRESKVHLPGGLMDQASVTKAIQEFLSEHGNILRHDGVHAGGWFSKADSTLYIDASVRVGTLKEAETLADTFNQLAVYDVKGGDIVKMKSVYARRGLDYEKGAINVEEALALAGTAGAVALFMNGSDGTAEMGGVALAGVAALLARKPLSEVYYRTIGSGKGRLVGLPGEVHLPGRGKVAVKASVPARKAAAAYRTRTGLGEAHPKDFAQLDVPRAQRIAEEFEKMEHRPHDPEVVAAYDQMIKETLDQYQDIKKTGLKIEFIDFDKIGDPYKASPRMAIMDVQENNHLWVFPTSSGFGGEASAAADISGNPLLKMTDEMIDGKQLQANDVFRIVHDYFGHIAEGVGFRAVGEENAWRLHSTMYSPQARRAMTSETRGQNSWVNFGPHAEANRTASGAATEYAPQKIGLLPEWVSTDGAPLPAKAKLFTNQRLMVGAAGATALGLYLNDPEAFGESMGVAGLGLAGIMIGPKGAKSLSASIKEWSHVEPALLTAKNLKAAGKDMEAIRQETGWFEHPADKQWRFEVSTKDAMGFKGLDFSTEFSKSGTAGDMVSLGILEKAYPDLAQWKVSVTNRVESSRTGYANASKKEMGFNTVSKDLLKTNLTKRIDEAQSAIKGHEDALAKYRETSDVSVFEKSGSKLKYGGDLTHEEVIERAEMFIGATTNSLKTAIKGLEDVEGAFHVTKGSPNEVPEHLLVHETQHAIQAHEGFASGGSPETAGGFKNYTRLAGEAEARLAETRMNLSAEELKATPPLSQLDVPLDELIVRFGHDTPMLSAAAPGSQPVVDAQAALDAGGYRKMGALRPGVVKLDGAVILPDSGFVANTHASLALPWTTRAPVPSGARIGWAPADIVGTDVSNTARYVSDLIFHNAVGKRTADGLGRVRVEGSADVLQDMGLQSTVGRMHKIAEEGLYSWMRDVKGMEPSQSNDFRMDHKVEYNRLLADGFRGRKVPHMVEKAVKEMNGITKSQLKAVKDMVVRQGITEEGSQIYRLSLIDASDTYFPRGFHAASRDRIALEFGEAGVEKIVMASRKHHFNLETDAELLALAKGWLRGMDAMGNNMTSSMGVFDRELVRKTLIESGVSPAHAEVTLNHMKNQSEAGVPSMMQERMEFSETHPPVKFTRSDGTEVEYTLSDLLENDPMVAWRKYHNVLEGQLALGQVGERAGLDLTNEKTWMLLTAQMKAEGADPRAIELLNAGREANMGRDNGKTWRSADPLVSSMLKMTSARFGMYFGVSQTAEIGKEIPQMQMARVTQNIPGMNLLKSAAGRSQLEEGLARDIANMTGQGLEHLMPSLQQDVEAGIAGKVYQNISMGTHKMMIASGFYATADGGKYMASANALGKLYDHASKGGQVIVDSDWKHMASLGIDKTHFDTVIAPMINKFIKVDADDIIIGFDFDGALRTDYNNAKEFFLYLKKVGADSSSEALGNGQRMPWMTTTAGRVMTQFQAPAIVSTQRLRRDSMNMDSQIAARWMSSFMVSGANYVARAFLSTIGDDEAREKKLAPHALFNGALRNASFSGLLPTAISAASAVTPWAPMSEASNSGRVGLAGPAVFSAIQQVAQSAKDVTSAAVSSDVNMTKKQANQAFRAVNPLFYLQGAFQAITSGLPDKQPVQPKPD